MALKRKGGLGKGLGALLEAGVPLGKAPDVEPSDNAVVLSLIHI